MRKFAEAYRNLSSVQQLAAQIPWFHNCALLEEFAGIDPSCIDAFEPLCGKEYCFGWEDSLVRIFDERIK